MKKKKKSRKRKGSLGQREQRQSTSYEQLKNIYIIFRNEGHPGFRTVSSETPNLRTRDRDSRIAGRWNEYDPEKQLFCSTSLDILLAVSSLVIYRILHALANFRFPGYSRDRDAQ